MARFANKEKEAALDRDFLHSVLSYYPETGWFEWVEKRGPNGKGPGRQAGYVMKNGYRIIKINFNKFLAGRLAWFYVFGDWPENEIDHINRNREDNRIENLRLSTRNQNMWNVGVSNRNTTGLLNISPLYQQGIDYFRVSITRHGKRIFQKKCRSLDSAIAARDAALSSFSDANQTRSAGV
jgi:hypothetical protein